MNEYIINPSWFYWANLLDGLGTLFIVIGALSVATCITLSIISWAEISFEGEVTDKAKRLIKWSIISGCGAFVLMLIGIFIPSKETMTEMLIAQVATKQNVQYSLDAIKEIADYILQAVGK
jgi:cytochrome bd-type quinol oxidase subunit 2